MFLEEVIVMKVKGAKDLRMEKHEAEASQTLGREINFLHCFESAKPLSYTDRVAGNKQLSS